MDNMHLKNQNDAEIVFYGEIGPDSWNLLVKVHI